MKTVYLLTTCTDEEDSSNAGFVHGIYEDESDALAYAVCYLTEIIEEDPDFWGNLKVASGKTWCSITLGCSFATDYLSLLVEEHEIKEKL